MPPARAASHTRDSEQVVLNKSQDTDFDVLATLGLIYNPATGNLDRLAGVDAQYILYDANDAQPTYIGINNDSDAEEGDTDWLVYKFLYSGSDATSIRRKVGSWTGRAALFA